MGKVIQIKAQIVNNLPSFIAQAAKVNNLMELATLYGLPNNGRSSVWLRCTLNEQGFDVKQYHRQHSEKLQIHSREPRRCLNCNKEFEWYKGIDSNARYCSRSCSNKARKHSEETKIKISRSVIAYNGHEPKRYNGICEECQEPWGPSKHSKRFCSRRCSARYFHKQPEYREKMRQRELRKIAEGTHTGWKSRSKIESSYPEKFFIKVLNNNHISYIRELPCAGYFIDFAVTLENGIKIALEIDGKQHQLPERQESDRRKDTTLRQYGWKVYRIKWKSINSQSGKTYIKAEIERFLSYHNKLLLGC